MFGARSCFGSFIASAVAAVTGVAVCLANLPLLQVSSAPMLLIRSKQRDRPIRPPDAIPPIGDDAGGWFRGMIGGSSGTAPNRSSGGQARGDRVGEQRKPPWGFFPRPCGSYNCRSSRASRASGSSGARGGNAPLTKPPSTGSASERPLPKGAFLDRKQLQLLATKLIPPRCQGLI